MKWRVARNGRSGHSRVKLESAASDSVELASTTSERSSVCTQRPGVEYGMRRIESQRWSEEDRWAVNLWRSLTVKMCTLE